MAGISDVYKAAGGAASGLTEDGIKKVFSGIVELVRSGENVQIRDFGTFKKVHTEERQGINPQNPKEKLTIAAKDHLKFKASPSVDLTPPKPTKRGRK